MNMNLDLSKRYCQNRACKRKKEPSLRLDPAEEERNFKLSRFVKDVSKFVEEKENYQDIILQNNYKINRKQSVTKVKTLNRQPVAKKGLFQNGVQTQFFSRTMSKETEARLDENLAEIIGLVNKDAKTNQSNLQILYKHKTTRFGNDTESPNETLKTSHIDIQTSSVIADRNSIVMPLLKSTAVSQEESFPTSTQKESLNDLEGKLYLEFTRLVTMNCAESKAAQFKKQSYASDVKRKLMDIYLEGKKENTQDSSCASQPQKSSVATSPLALSPASENGISRDKQAFTQINFVAMPTISNLRFLKETVGFGSSCHDTGSSSEPQESRPSPLFSQVYQSSPDLQSCSQPFTSKPDGYCLPELSPNLNFLKSSFPPHHFIPYNYNSMKIFGEIDRHPFNQLNWFLPPVEDDSPEFRYFPRRMF